MKVLAISGSLRKASYNTALIHAAQKIAPAGMEIELAEISGIPVYNDDVYQQGFPEAVLRFKAQIVGADALLISTPEYNYSIPGSLKNAIDWASRPPGQPFSNKPIAIMGATMGIMGTSRAQYHLRQVLTGLNAHVVNKPEVMVSTAQTKFDEQGNLTDEATRGFLLQLLVSLQTWTTRLHE